MTNFLFTKHATCPICRNNITGTETTDPEAPTLDNPRSTLLNIFPLNATGFSSHRTIDQAVNPPPRNTSSTTTHSNYHRTNQSRVSNRQLYRIQIRQALNNASDQPALERRNALVRQRRLIPLATDSQTESQRQSGVRATAVLINPQWSRSAHPSGSNNEQVTGTNSEDSSNVMSAFSLMNEYRNFQRRTSQNGAGDAASETGTSVNTASEATDESESNGSSGSRISTMVDRLLSRYRTSRLARSYLHSNRSGGRNAASKLILFILDMFKLLIQTIR